MNIKYHLKECFLSEGPIRLYLLRQLLKRYPFFSYKFRLEIDAFRYPAYSYGMYCAALQAKALNLNAISVVEFGVAAGHGLIEIETYAEQIFNEIGVDIKIYGFDSGIGLPASTNYKDQIYFWGQGDFKQDKKFLNAKLSKSEIIYGEVSETTNKFFQKDSIPPIGFIAFDLDYFTSTEAALKILNKEDKYFLPRVECFFDDVGSTELLCACQETGVLKAISEYNETSDNQILRKMGLKASRRYSAFWNEGAYVQHRFKHKNYNSRVTDASGFQSRLT